MVGNHAFEAMRELCGDTTLKHVVLVTQGWGPNDPSEPATSQQQLGLTTDDVENDVFKPAIENGAQVYHRVDRSKPVQDILRMILQGRKAAPNIQPELVDEGGESWQTVEPSKEMGELVGGDDSYAEELESMRKTMDEKVKSLQRELDEQKRGAQLEADAFKKCIGEMRSKEESMRKDMDQKAEEHHRELEEQKRRAQEEASGLRKCIAEMQSKLEEDRHSGSGEVFATHSFRPAPTCPVLPFDRIFCGTAR